MRKVGLSLAVLLCLAGVAQAATSIVVGNHILQPNQAGQVVQIFVAGGDQIQGMNLNAQIGADPENAVTPVFEFGGGAGASTIIGAGTIFAPNNVGMNDVTFYPALFQAGTATSTGTVAANGLLATLVIDTTGFFSGTWALSLNNTLGGPTDWAGSIFNGNEVPNPEIIDGSITIEIPEPTSIVMGMFGLAGLGAVAIRRRRARQA
jgi:MYXO-CTERM domain-containing protein